jgi:hypothetical protein
VRAAWLRPEPEPKPAGASTADAAGGWLHAAGAAACVVCINLVDSWR